jgi:mannose-6-phosphate isomerase-like protein (cupin superfamily)
MATTARSGEGSKGSRAPRRVVSATDDHGKSRVASDGRSLASLEVWGAGSTLFHNVWRTDSSSRVPYPTGSPDPAATFTEMSQIFPGPGGTHFTISIWPANYPPEDTLPMWMHSTATVDYILIMSGEICCFFDSGEKVTLSAGDCLVQNGTEHAWRNESASECAMAAIAVGVIRDNR